MTSILFGVYVGCQKVDTETTIKKNHHCFTYSHYIVSLISDTQPTAL